MKPRKLTEDQLKQIEYLATEDRVFLLLGHIKAMELERRETTDEELRLIKRMAQEPGAMMEQTLALINRIERVEAERDDLKLKADAYAEQLGVV